MTGASSLSWASRSRSISSRFWVTTLGVAGLLGHLLDHLLHLVPGAVDAAERLENRALGGDHRDDLELGALPQIVEREHVQRIGHRDEELVPQAADGRELVGPGHVLGHQVEHLLGHADAREIDRRRIQAAAHRDHHVLLGDVVAVGQNLQQAAALLLLDFRRLVELAGKEEPILDEDIRDAFAK